tara:strand:- start:7322 stop:8089 length:768 start_codon:yes stop_codon:yes gene_type:complete
MEEFMSLIMSSDGSSENLPKLQPGIYSGTCYQIIDLGTRDEVFQGDITKKTQVIITFEVTEALEPSDNMVKMEDGRPFAVSGTYTASLFEQAKLHKHLVSWRGRAFTEEELQGFDISKLLGCTARIEVTHTKPSSEGKGGGNPKVDNLHRPDGGIKVIDTENEKKSFDLDIYLNHLKDPKTEGGEGMADMFDTFPDWLQNKIKDSYEYKKAVGTSTETSMSDEVSKLTDEAAQSNSPDFDDTEDNDKLTNDDIPF